MLLSTTTTSTRLPLQLPVSDKLKYCIREPADYLPAEYPSVKVVAVIEPDSLANLVTNLDKPKCAGAQAAYKEGVVYAIKKLAALNVYMYIDAGHAGWLGWPANLTPAAQLFTQIYQDAGSPKALRGLSTSKYPPSIDSMVQGVLTGSQNRCCQLQCPPRSLSRPRDSP